MGLIWLVLLCIFNMNISTTKPQDRDRVQKLPGLVPAPRCSLPLWTHSPCGHTTPIDSGMNFVGTKCCIMTIFCKIVHLQNTSLETPNNEIYFLTLLIFKTTFAFQGDEFGVQDQLAIDR